MQRDANDKTPAFIGALLGVGVLVPILVAVAP